MTDKLITANSLGDGLVVFLTGDGSWTTDIAGARLIGPSDLDAALAYAKAQQDAQIVVEAYEIETAVEDGVPVPVRLRERIRAGGPTVAYGEAELAERHAASNRLG